MLARSNTTETKERRVQGDCREIAIFAPVVEYFGCMDMLLQTVLTFNENYYGSLSNVLFNNIKREKCWI